MIQKGFTLIELMIVIALIAFIGSVIFVAVDPAKRIGEAKDAVRLSNTLTIGKALSLAIMDHDSVPVAMESLTGNTPYMLVTEGGSTSGTCNCNVLDEAISRVDMATEFQDYIGSYVPVDDDATDDDTGYYIVKTNNKFQVSSCNAYGDEFDIPEAACNGFSRPFCPDMTSSNGVEDGLVNFEDLTYFAMGMYSCAADPESWFESFWKADFNNDCCIDSLDQACFEGYYGTSVDCATFTGTCP
ncbi:type II secretion system protein [Patescibacteria group bacterium]|nr:type II secretion system protein [Patescibacteria group bacterium]